MAVRSGTAAQPAVASGEWYAPSRGEVCVAPDVHPRCGLDRGHRGSASAEPSRLARVQATLAFKQVGQSRFRIRRGHFRGRPPGVELAGNRCLEALGCATGPSADRGKELVSS
jgi:hypothetical protein